MRYYYLLLALLCVGCQPHTHAVPTKTTDMAGSDTWTGDSNMLQQTIASYADLATLDAEYQDSDNFTFVNATLNPTMTFTQTFPRTVQCATQSQVITATFDATTPRWTWSGGTQRDFMRCLRSIALEMP